MSRHTTSSFFIVLAALLTATAFAIGTAGAMDHGTPASHANGTFQKGAWQAKAGTGNTTLQMQHLKTMVAHLGQQGVDVSEPTADLAAGNLQAAGQWFASYRKDHPASGFNSTAVKNNKPSGSFPALHACNATAGKTGSKTLQSPANAGRQFNSTQQQERMQAFLSGLEKNGIDTSGLKTAVAANDSAAVRAWMASHMPAHRNATAAGTSARVGSATV